MSRYRDLECVQLRADVPDHSLKTGEVGTIVHVFDAADAYLVEFTNDDGSTRVLAELTPQQIVPDCADGLYAKFLPRLRDSAEGCADSKL